MSISGKAATTTAAPSGDSLSPGVIAAIVICILIAFVIILALSIVICRLKSGGAEPSQTKVKPVKKSKPEKVSKQDSQPRSRSPPSDRSGNKVSPDDRSFDENPQFMRNGYTNHNYYKWGY